MGVDGPVSEHDWTSRTVALTGATGYLGGRLRRRFEALGWKVLPLVRNPTALPGAVRFRLGDRVSPSIFAGTQALIHCAYDFGVTRYDDIIRVNVEGTRNLLDAARQSGVASIVCVSTISAFEGCKSLYGQAKLQIEGIASSAGSIVVRPGLIWGSPPGAMFGRLVRQVERSRIVPLIGDGSQLQYLVHEEDLTEYIARCAARTVPAVEQAVTVAHPQGWSFRKLLDQIAADRGLQRAFVRIPAGLIWGALRAAEGLRIPLNFRSDSVVSLMNQNPAPDFSIAERLGVRCRPYP
jgi:nucleoside-diphosphate-sugar epimerase